MPVRREHALRGQHRLRRGRGRRRGPRSSSTSAPACASGARPCPPTAPSTASALVTHMHWDHVQGLPFFVPADRAGARFDIYGPTPEEGSLGEVFDDLMRPPYFPVTPIELAGDIRFHDVNRRGPRARQRQGDGRGPCPTSARPTATASSGTACRSPTSATTRRPSTQRRRSTASVLELADGVDLLIHDAQYTPDEWEQKAHWGHCTVDYAVHVAREAGARSAGAVPPRPRPRRRADRPLLDGARATAARLGRRRGHRRRRGLDHLVRAHVAH